MQIKNFRHPERKPLRAVVEGRPSSSISLESSSYSIFPQDALGMYWFLFLFIFPTYLTPFSIMLDPAGDAHHAGRIIDDCFERGLTLQFCENLKKELEKKHPVHVILTRTPGDTLEPLQNASFANRLGVQIYISFHFFQEAEERSKINLYHFIHNPVTDFWSPQQNTLRFIRFDEAHKITIQQTSNYVQQLHKSLSKTIKHADTAPAVSLPFKPLLGITAPAIGIEISLHNRNDWRNYISGMAQAIGALVP